MCAQKKKQVQRFRGFISALLAKEACDLAGVFQQMECDAMPPAPRARTDNLLRATETRDNLVVWGGWGGWFPPGLIMFLLQLATCFNLLAAICRQADRDVMLEAQSQRGGSISACVFLHAAFGSSQWCQTWTGSSTRAADSTSD